MTVYLHRPELDTLLSEITRICGSLDGMAEELERRGICTTALGSIAREISEEAIEHVAREDTATYEESIADVYICGVALGLLASERVGR